MLQLSTGMSTVDECPGFCAIMSHAHLGMEAFASADLPPLAPPTWDSGADANGSNSVARSVTGWDKMATAQRRVSELPMLHNS